MNRNTKMKVSRLIEQLRGVRSEIEAVAADESEVQDRYPTDSDEYERHGYNVMLLEDSMSFIKDSLGELTESLEYEDVYEE